MQHLWASRKCCKQKTYGKAKPFRCNTYKKRGRGAVRNDFARLGALSSSSHLPYTLPSSVSRKSFNCHSYENCRGVYQQFPLWNLSRRFPSVPPRLCGKSAPKGRGSPGKECQGQFLFSLFQFLC